MSEVVLSINQTCEHKIPEERARQLFSALWPEMEKKLENIPQELPTAKRVRSQHEILEELVSGVRSLEGRFRDIEGMVMDPDRIVGRRRRKHMHPMMIDEWMHMGFEKGDESLALLLLAGMLREDMPWLAEVVVETHRQMADGL